MSSLTLATRDAATMVRRNLKHQQRYLGLAAMMIATPVIVLLLFVFVFGGTMGAGLPGVAPDAGRAAYLAFVTPGVLLLGVALSAQSVAILIASDTTSGIVERFRSLSISRGAFLTGHVVGAVAQMLAAGVAVVAVAVALGYRPAAGVLGWSVVVAIHTLTCVAITWVIAALALRAKNVESASNLPNALMLLPFLGSGFVPTESMPVGLRWFADHQPFSAFMDALRGSLAGAPDATAIWMAVAWGIGLTVLGYLWAIRNYERER